MSPFSDYAEKAGPMVRMIYPMLWPWIKKAIDDPEDKWDEQVLEVLDRVFGYEE